MSGEIGSGNAAIHLTSHFNGPPVGNSVNFIDAFQTLHELVHLGGRNGYYTDTQVATTLFAHCEKNKPDSAAHLWDYLKSFFW